MDGARRIYLSCVVEKINNNRRYADKIGTKNISKWRDAEDKNQEVRKHETCCN